MNDQLKAKLNTLPVSPGVYFHKSAKGEIIYVGKAAVLRNRVRQYFQSSRSMDNKTLALVNEIADVDWIETESEVDALFLESEMVKRYMPRYNILLRDDKSQSFVRIDIKSDWPTVTLTRNPLDDGAEYIGPFYNTFALKRALRYLRRIFPYLTTPRRPGQSTLNEDLGLSPRLSDGIDAYKSSLRRLLQYVKGNRAALMKDIEREMRQAAKDQRFEEAAALRNKLQSMNELKRRVMFGEQEFMDISKDQALRDLANIFGLDREPVRIEGFDISHISGTSVVASMVVFLNGVSARAEYRKFKLSKQQNDDVANMYEIISRRFSERNIKSWGMPNLVVIDGGKSQLKSAIEAIKKQNIRVPIISIAKRNEEIIIDKNNSQVNLDGLTSEDYQNTSVVDEGEYWVINLHVGKVKSSSHASNLRGVGGVGVFDDVTRLFQRIRDESHRFAVSYHEVLRRKNQTKNILEEIPGIGSKTRASLIKSFGSVRAIEKASEQDIAKVVGRSRAALIKQHLSRPADEMLQ
ncbi:excinuclease ABC subunit C [Candidatus Saccharibacteria bacterium 32-49-12]|nr:MAG: excinuclease ABC subunit C [Candidatus Saccharibacteria bacterium 32-49-12]